MTEVEMCCNCGRVPAFARGRCNACYQYRRTHGTERPRSLYQRPDHSACVNCGREGQLVSGRCDACRVYLSRNGTERPLSVAQLQDMVGQWGDRTFPREDRDLAIIGCLAHLREEIDELECAALSPRDDPAHELADVFILAFQVAHLLRIDAGAAVRAKMAENRRRTWGAPDERGVVRHVEPEEDTG